MTFGGLGEWHGDMEPFSDEQTIKGGLCLGGNVWHRQMLVNIVSDFRHSPACVPFWLDSGKTLKRPASLLLSPAPAKTLNLRDFATGRAWFVVQCLQHPGRDLSQSHGS